MANALAWVTSGIKYIVAQDFENAGIPSGWSDLGGCTFHNTVSPLEGTGDLKVTGAGTNKGAYALSPLVSELWMVGLLKFTILPSAASAWFGVRSSSFANVCFLRVSSTGTVSCFNDSGAAFGTMASTIVAGTLYYCKIHYKTGTGANSISSAELSTSGTWINSGSFYVSTTTGVSTTDAGQLTCECNDGENRYDHIRMSATDLGNSFSNWP